MDWKTRLRPLIGFAICAVSALIFCITNVMVKHLSHVNPFLISTIRFWIIGLMSTPISVSLSSRQNEEEEASMAVFPAGKRRLLLIRSVLGATNLMVHFYSLQVSYIRNHISFMYLVIRNGVKCCIVSFLS